MSWKLIPFTNFRHSKNRFRRPRLKHIWHNTINNNTFGRPRLKQQL